MFWLSFGAFCRAAGNTRSLRLLLKSVPVYRWKGALPANCAEKLRHERWRMEPSDQKR